MNCIAPSRLTQARDQRGQYRERWGARTSCPPERAARALSKSYFHGQKAGAGCARWRTGCPRSPAPGTDCITPMDLADDKEHREHLLFIQLGEQQGKQINKEDQDFGSNHIGHDRADKKAFLAFEDYPARVA